MYHIPPTKMEPGTERHLTRREVVNLYHQGLHANRGDNWCVVCEESGQLALRYKTTKVLSFWALQIDKDMK